MKCFEFLETTTWRDLKQILQHSVYHPVTIFTSTEPHYNIVKKLSEGWEVQQSWFKKWQKTGKGYMAHFKIILVK